MSQSILQHHPVRIWRTILWIALPSAIVAWAFAAYTSRLSILDSLCREDGWVESLTAVAYVLAGGLLIYSTARGESPRTMRYLLAALFLVIAAEEISWGQRLMNVSTPESIAKVNVQGELSLHNLQGVHGTNRRLGLIFIACYCFALPVLVKKSRVIQNLCKSWGIPIISFQAIGWLTAGIVAMAVPRVFAGEIVFELDEIGEFMLSVGFLHFVMIEFTRSPQASTH